MTRTYNELIRLKTFEERFRYLQLKGVVGRETFGFERYLNQKFYRSAEWRKFRRDILIRDMGCDLAIPSRPLYSKIIVHHMNPIHAKDITDRVLERILNPNEVVCVSPSTHDAIHYGDESLLIPSEPISRRPNDTSPWR